MNDTAIGVNAEALKENVEKILPTLEENLSATHSEYMSGNLPRGAYEHVLARHALALDIINCDIVEPDKAFAASSMLTLDVRAFVRLSDPERQPVLDNWVQFLQASGLTASNRFFDIPAFPVAA